MIIPYGHRSMKLGGLPWATVAIFCTCVVAFGLTAGPDARASRESFALFTEIAEIYLDQPSLELDPELEDLLLQQLGIDDNQRGVFFDSLAERQAAVSPRAGEGRQRELDALTRQFWSVYRGAPSYRFGVVPSAVSPVNLVTYQFLHGSWAHLLGNLLFLYLAAPHIEERWGRPLFLAFYLAAGIVAAIFWAVRYPDLDLPLVGASGSIAGLMGAFLICFGTSKIRFFYWFLVVWGTFEAPAWLMLPLWLAIEVVSGRTMDVLSQGGGGGGVAHWAHVWGFIFGMAVAGGLSLLGIDAKLAARNAAGTGPEAVPERVDRALRMASNGHTDEALAVLRRELATNPGEASAARAVWSICRDRGRAAEAVPEMLGLIRRFARHGDDGRLVELWQELMSGAPEATIDPPLAVHVIGALEREGFPEAVVETVSRVDPRMIGGAPWQALVPLAVIALDQGLSVAPRLRTAALAAVDLPAADRRRLEQLEHGLPVEVPEDEVGSKQPLEMSGGPGPDVELRPAERVLVMEAAPRALDDGVLLFESGGVPRRLELAEVHGLAVGAILRPGGRPFLVIDLLLDPPSDGAGDLRVVRCRSSSFDPRRLVGGDRAMAAFVLFIERLLEASGAASLPDAETVREPTRRSYGSLEEYQEAVLGVTG